MTGGEILLECLEAQGARAIFGMPGTQNLALYDAFHRSGGRLSHYLVRHEQSATLMAGGYARATGEVGIALTVPGPGASNAATGIGDAFTDCQPVLLITGGVERALQDRDRSKMFHGLDQGRFFAPMVRYYGCPRSADQIPHAVRAAFAAIWSGRPGPAVLEIPPDVAAEEVAGSACIPQRIGPRSDKLPHAAAVQQAAALIRSSARPAILAGGDVIQTNATVALERLASRLAAPVIESRLAKGSIPSNHPLSAGNSRHKRAKAVLKGADLLIAVGTRFTQIDTANWELPFPEQLIQIDRDPAEIGRELPVTAGLAGDLAQSIELLLQVLGPSHPARQDSDLAAIQSEYARPPVPVLHEIRQVLPRDGILAADITSLSYRGFDEYPVQGPREFIYSCHYVTMGCGLPFALGAKVACPNRPVVAMCGDGGVLMAIAELATAVQYGIAAVIVVVVDRALMAIKASQVKHYEGRLIDTDLPGPDFVALARSFGMCSDRAADLAHFKSLLRQAIDSNQPCLIEVPMTGHEKEIMQQIPWLTGE